MRQPRSARRTARVRDASAALLRDDPGRARPVRVLAADRLSVRGTAQRQAIGAGVPSRTQSLPRKGVPVRHKPRGGRPRVADRERIARAYRLRIPFADLLAHKAAQEERVISEREVRAVTGLQHHRIKALQRGECARLELGEIEVLLAFFDCTLDELVQQDRAD